MAMLSKLRCVCPARKDQDGMSRKLSRWLVVWCLILDTSQLAWGQTADLPSREELDSLRQQVESLTRQLDELQTRYAADRVERGKSRADSPRITLDSRGLRVQSEDGAFQHQVRLRIAHDFAWFSQDENLKRFVGDEQDGTGFRYARIRLQGRLWDDFTYTGEFDFAGQTGEDTPKFRDVYLQYSGIPYWGSHAFDLRIGHFKEPFGLDELTSVTDLLFIENPLLDVFMPSRNIGAQASDALLGDPKKERLTWALGLFKETGDIPSSAGSDEDQGWQVTGRVTGLPYYACDGARLIHLGAAYSHRNPDGALLRYGVKPESNLSLYRYVNPDALPKGFRLQDARAEQVDLYGLELAGILGPFTFQSEYVRSGIQTCFGGDLSFDGYYLQAAYLLTGERHLYRHDTGCLDSPEPANPFRLRGEDRGWGAWEAAVRYGTVDMTDGPIRGGEHRSLTLGINWYLNNNIRVSANCIRNEVDHDLYDGRFDVFQTRFQLEF